VAALAGDLAAALEDAERQPTPPRRRGAVRAFLAFVTGDTHLRRRLALGRCESGAATLTPAQLALLRGEQYSLGDRGDARARPLALPLLADVRFSLQALAAAFGVEFLEAVNGHGWTSFVRAVAVAQRLTRPGGAADLEVSDPEFASLVAARSWYDDTRGELMRRVAAALEASGKPGPIPDGILIRTELPVRRQAAPRGKAARPVAPGT
jgi:hypothetical protein